MGCKYRIEIEALENGYTVSVPDYDAMAAKEKEAKARAKKNGMSYSPDYYIGNLTKEYAAKTVKEVMGLVQKAVNRLPSDSEDAAYDAAYAEARGS